MELDKPFIMLFSNQKLTTGYLRDFRKKHKKHLQIIIPKTSITFEKLEEDGNCVKTCRFACFFSECVYFGADYYGVSVLIDARNCPRARCQALN